MRHDSKSPRRTKNTTRSKFTTAGSFGLSAAQQNSILGMASHDLSNTKATIVGAAPGAIPQMDGNTHEQGAQSYLTLRAQGLKKFKILKFSSGIENFKRATHQSPILCGEF